MYSVDNNNTCEAPILENFFKKLSRPADVKYCVVCLRTEQERRLVKNKAFKQFTAAMKIDRNWRNHLICFMCERQASNALKFFNATTYAAAMDKIFPELWYQKHIMKLDIFEEYNFQRTINRFCLGDTLKTPSEWDNEVKYIQKASQLIETQPLVVDNRGVDLQMVQNASSPEEVYVIPDDPPNTYGRVTAMATRSQGTTMYPGQVGAPPLVGTSGRPDAAAEHVIRNDTFLLGSPEPKISETFVILDEDDEPLQIKIDKVESTADKPTQSTSQSLLQNILMNPHDPPQIPPKTPTLVPLETLLEKPKEIFTGDSLLVGTSTGNYTLHPIAIKEGVTTIPSLQAKIINGKLLYDNMHTLVIGPSDNTMLQDLIQNPPNEISISTNDAFSQTNQASGSQNSINFATVLLTNKAEEHKNGKRDPPDDGITKFATPSKKVKELPVEKEVAATDKNGRIDWEDKIPMDVISFVDALDPNREPQLIPKVGSTQAGPCIQPKILNTDFIDLC